MRLSAYNASFAYGQQGQATYGNAPQLTGKQLLFLGSSGFMAGATTYGAMLANHASIPNATSTGSVVSFTTVLLLYLNQLRNPR
jgi:hypothetical protein